MSPLALRFAARELRSGVRGFRIFLACLALGVAAIAAAGSTAEAFRQGLAAQAREILGGDLAVSSSQRDFTPAERAAFARAGRVVYAAGAQAMAQAPSATSGGWSSCAASAPGYPAGRPGRTAGRERPGRRLRARRGRRARGGGRAGRCSTGWA